MIRENQKRESKNSSDMSKTILSGVVAFILAIVLTLLTSLIAVYFGFFNTNNIIVSFNKVDYYNQVMKHFNENAWDITIPMGLPQDVLADIVNVNKLSRDVKGGLTAGLDKTDYTVDTVDLEVNLDANVRAYFEKEGTQLDENQNKVLKEYTSTIASEYLNCVQIPLIKYFGYAKELYGKVILAGVSICVILAVAAITLLIKIRRWKHRGIRFITYAVLGTALMTSVVPAGILLSGVYEKVQLSPAYFYEFVMSYVKGGLMVFLYFAIIWSIMAILLMFITGKLRKKLLHRRR